MIIVAGYLRTGAGQRDAFIAGSLTTVRAARQALPSGRPALRSGRVARQIACWQPPLMIR